MTLSFCRRSRGLVLARCCVLGVCDGLAASERVEAAAPSFAVDANYPGGNIVVERIEGDTVSLRPDLRDTEGWWFYWGFRVRGAQGRSLTFAFSGRNPIGVRGPAVSTDGGRSWSWLGAEAVKDGSFRVRLCRRCPGGAVLLCDSLSGGEPQGIPRGLQGQSGPLGAGTLQDAARAKRRASARRPAGRPGAAQGPADGPPSRVRDDGATT